MAARNMDVDALRRPAGRPLALRVHPAAERALRRGHPWVFGDSVRSTSHDGEAGDVAVVFDRNGRFLAAGLYDPEGPIRTRVLVHERPAEIGPDLFRDRISRALALRNQVASRQTTGFRVVSGGNDGMPGLVADLYGRTLVLEIFTTAWLAHLRDLTPVFQELLAPERILLLASARVAAGDASPAGLADGAVLAGEASGGGAAFRETGLGFEAHPFQGHKTGFYLDQRANRRRLAKHTSGARVLNVFSYTGGFSVHAARGGAREVLSVDRAAPVLAQARRHFELNRDDPAVDACRHRTLEGDAFEVMSDLAGRGERFDVVVLDPPSFARASRHRSRAIGAYGRLTSLALPLLTHGGVLVQASCSTRVGRDEFFAAVHGAAARADRPLEELERTGHPPDHPVTFPEGEYLKCLFARAP